MPKKNAISSNLPLVVVLVVAVVLAGLILLSRGLEPNGAGSVATIDNARLAELVDGGARLVDVRSQGEYDAGHIEGAELVPVETVASVADGWDREQPVVLYCATGARSADAAKVLAGMGFEVYDLTAGIVSWDGTLSNSVSQQSSGGGRASTAGLPVMYEFSTDS